MLVDKGQTLMGLKLRVIREGGDDGGRADDENSSTGGDSLVTVASAWVDLTQGSKVVLEKVESVPDTGAKEQQ